MPLDAAAIRQLFSVEGAAWASFVVVALLTLRMWNGAPAMFGKWIEWRVAKAAEKAADWTRLRGEIDRYGTRIEYLEQREEECQRKLAEAEGRIAKLEGYEQGRGEARQETAVLRSAERIVKRKDEGK